MSKERSEELLQLQKELKDRLEFKNGIIFLFEESIPENGTERKKYMGDIALFYQSVFKDKLKHFIGEQMKELALIGRSEMSTNIIRSSINCFRLIDEWMQEKTNEHIGDIEELRKHAQDDQEFINNIKETYDEN